MQAARRLRRKDFACPRPTVSATVCFPEAVTMRRTLVLVSIFALITAGAVFAKDDKLSEPPPGITPTTVTVGQNLKQYDAAVGKLKAGAAEAARETWHFTEAGLPSTETHTRQALKFNSK